MEITFLIILAIALFIIGCAYSALIYHSPAPPGLTWISVVVGDGINDLALGAAILVVMMEYDLTDQLWWLSLFPLAAHLLSGLPMIVGQELKRRRENNNKKQILENYG